MKKYEAMVKLDLPGDERQWVGKRAEELLESFSALDSFDMPAVENCDPCPQANLLRADTAQKKLTRDQLLSNAPEQYNGFFQIPRTV